MAFFAFVFFLACFVLTVVGYLATRRTSEDELRRRVSEFAETPYGYAAIWRRAPIPGVVFSFFGLILGTALLVHEYMESAALEMLAVIAGIAWAVTIGVTYYVARRGRPAFLVDRRLRDDRSWGRR